MELDVAGICGQYGLLALHQLMQSKLTQFLYHNTNMSNAIHVMWEVRLRRQSV